MTPYSSLKRSFAATLTIGLIVGALYLVYRNGANSNPAVAEDKKAARQDWTMYGGSPLRNMANTAVKGLPKDWDVGDPKKKVKPVNIKWVAELGSKAYGGPIIADGRVFVGTNNMNPRDKQWAKIVMGKPIDLGIIMCFDEATGNFNWQAVHQKLPGGQVIDWPYEGICSSPHVDGDRLYYVSNRCEVVCADVKTGKEIWNYDMIAKQKVFPHNISDCSPLLVDGHLWVVTSNGVNEQHLDVPQPGAPSFIKLKAGKDQKDIDKDDAVVWKENWPTKKLLQLPKGANAANFFKELVNRGQLIQHGQWANIAYDKASNQIILPGGDGWIYSVDLNGNLIWKFDCNPRDAKYALRTGERSDFIATPVIYKNRVYIGTGQDPEHGIGIGHFWCIDMGKGKNGEDVSPELVTDDTVFPPKTKKNPQSAAVWHYGGEIKDPTVRKKLQRNYYFGRTMSTAAIHEDLVYISDLNGILRCMDSNNGDVYWEFDTEGETWSSPYYADGKVYFGNDSKTLFVFEHGKKLNKLAENEMGARIRATPSAANGVLYVMTESKLYAIK